MLPAIFGTILVGMPFFLRKQIGWTAVLIAAVLITVSPTLLYVSRFFRHDPYVIVFFFATVICTWRYLDERKPRYLYLFGLFLGLAFATMEITYIYVAILLVYVNLMLAVELGQPRKDEYSAPDWFSRGLLLLAYGFAGALMVLDLLGGFGLHKQMAFLGLLGFVIAATSAFVIWTMSTQDAATDGRDEYAWALALAPFAWLIAAFWPLLGKRPFGRDRLPPIGDVMVVLGTLALTQFGPAVEKISFIGDRGYNVESEEPLRNVTLIVLLVAATYVGLLWKPKVWAIVAACFFIPYILLFTTFFTNMDGFFSGIWGSLDYWLAQQDVARGGQPKYYYLLLTPLYEFLPMLIALPGLIWMGMKGNSLTRFFLFWLIGMFVGVSVAGEKMPWLEIHIALPLCLCAAVVLAKVVERFRMTPKNWQTAAIVGAGIVAATLLIVQGRSSTTTVAGLAVGALALGWGIGSSMRDGRRGLLRVGAAFAVAVLFTLTVRASLYVSFKNYDTPVEMLVYTQSSHEIPELADRIGEIAKESGLGYNIPIVLDQTDGYAWPWAWYLRHYKDVSYVSDVQNYQPKPGAILLVHANNAASIDSVGYTQVPYKHRWWFNETYRGLTLGKVFDIATSWDRLESLGHFFLYRRPAVGNTGSTDAVAFFPDSLAAFDKSTPVQPPPEPETLPDGRIVFGRTGSGQGEMLQASDVVVDSSGTIWIADARANRISKYDSQGNFVGTLGRGGIDAGAFNQPWSLAIDADGNIYVADTWNHRIQKFDSTGQFIKQWGVVTNSAQPDLLDLYGPRDIVIDTDGTLWVTDTGHKRIINYSPDGEPLGAIGTEGTALGQFSEPVGLALDSQGRLLVADTWNARVQAIVNAGEITSFPVPWNSQGINDKPYLAVLTDGRILATDPAKGSILLYAPDGSALGAWTPAAGGRPVGITAMPDGGFVFTDAQNNQAQIVPAAAIATLFKK
jgi:predicted membrane-bound mannosyltransferase/sugar lactone lactonase YvrE